jgi:GDP-L-fucose synthase
MARTKVLVCGATGFIGRNVVESFARNDAYEVIAVAHRRPRFEHPGVRWLEADLTAAADVARAVRDVDVIVQAAATTSGAKDIVTRPYIHIADNAVMNSLLFRAAFDASVRHVVFFSCSIMLQSSAVPQAEDAFDANAELHNRYFGIGWTKVYLEKMCEFYSRIGPTKYTAIRHSNVYGPHDKFDLERSHVLGATVTKVMTARDGKLVLWGSGEEARDLLFVDDLVDFVDRAIQRQPEKFGLYNCGYGEAIKINELARRIVAQSGRALAIEHDLSQPTIPTSIALDCAKAQRELGWTRKTSHDEGIARTIAWWKANAGKAAR